MEDSYRRWQVHQHFLSIGRPEVIVCLGNQEASVPSVYSENGRWMLSGWSRIASRRRPIRPTKDSVAFGISPLAASGTVYWWVSIIRAGR